MKIAEFRQIVNSCNWSRNDLSGATRQEFQQCDVPTRLNRHIDAINTAIPLISKRFTDDLESAARAILHANTVIERWNEAQKIEAILTRGEIRALTKPKLYLVK
jgi:hypothetical protein